MKMTYNNNDLKKCCESRVVRYAVKKGIAILSSVGGSSGECWTEAS